MSMTTDLAALRSKVRELLLRYRQDSIALEVALLSLAKFAALLGLDLAFLLFGGFAQGSAGRFALLGQVVWLVHQRLPRSER